MPLRQPDLSNFDPEELELLDQVLDELRQHSGTSASALSHDDLGWRMVADNETIPYESAYLRPPVLTDAVRRHAAKLAAER